MQSAVSGRIALNAKALKKLRKINGVSQERLSEECLKRKIPVSVASIKRAEAGKNVLFRTIANLSSYFDIPVDQLLDDTPLSLWQYTKDKSELQTTCFGREFELQQLHNFYNQTLQSKRLGPVYITGLPGIGKSCLIKSFVQQIDKPDSQTIHLCLKTNLQHSKENIHFIIRRLIGVVAIASDSVIRHRVNEISNSPIMCFYLQQLAGVGLLPAEQLAIDRLSDDERQRLQRNMACQILNYLVLHESTLLIIENLQLADQELRYFLEALSLESSSFPVFLLLSASDIQYFAAPPSWLENTRQIHLKSLGEESVLTIISYHCQPQQQTHSSFAKMKVNLMKSSQGHPGLLVHQLQHGLNDLTAVSADSAPEMFEKNNSGNDSNELPAVSYNAQSSRLYQWVAETFRTFTREQKQLLSFLALAGFSFDIGLVGFFVENSNSRDTFRSLHHYLTEGLLQRVADKYCFRHSFIRMTVLDQISAKDKLQLNALKKDWLQQQVSRK